MIGQTLGHYRIVGKIGEGGMGIVYRARDERLDRDVAIKVLPAGRLADEAARKRFRKEALALSKLNHAHIATVHDFDSHDGLDFLVMEYVQGPTLAEKLRSGPLAEKQVTRFGAQLAEGLAAAHAQGVVHRDLKPANLRFTVEGELKILDFGLAELLRPGSEEAVTADLSQTKAVTGTLPYMAPEQLRGEPVDARTDIYAAGAVLYETVTGQQPFVEAQPVRLIQAILHDPPPPPREVNSRVSAELERIILKCLDKDPERRSQSARELRVDLERASAPVPLVSPVARPGAFVRRWPLVAGAALVVLLATVLSLNLGGWRDRLAGRASAPRIQSLAVLPLENLSHDPEQEYFSDGMTDALITELAQIRTLKVISRTSVMQYKGAKRPLPEIARKLNVDAVVEGSVQRSGDRLGITVQLIHGPTDQHLWAKAYERDLRDVLTLQREVARAIAGEIKITLLPEEKARLTGTRPVNPEAYQAYLKGRFYLNRRSGEGLQKAVEYFNEASRLDPQYAQAYAGLADAYNLGVFYGFPLDGEGIARARAASQKALAIDDSVAEAHAALGYTKFMWERDWPIAEQEFKRALELNPGYVPAHHWYAMYLAAIGRLNESIEEMKRAQQMDPLSLIVNTAMGYMFYFARQHDQAIEQCRAALALDSNFMVAYAVMGWAYDERGMHEEAIAALRKAVELSGDNPLYLASLGRAYARSGNKTAAQKILAELDGLSGRKFVVPSDRAKILSALGNHTGAMELLEKGHKQADASLVWLKVDPQFDSLRSDPRFHALLRRMNFPP